MSVASGKFVPPDHKKDAFNCPHCGAHAHQRWPKIVFVFGAIRDYGQAVGAFKKDLYSPQIKVDVSTCACCGKSCLWADSKLVAPDTSSAEPPNEDLSEDIREVYNEAASVLQKSPKSAAALLRLALQKLCVELGGKGRNLQDDIDYLIRERGLSRQLEKAMDAVRIIGNEAVHPGEINLKDDKETAAAMFGILNFIATKLISEPKAIESVYDSLPVSKKREGLRQKSDTGNEDDT